MAEPRTPGASAGSHLQLHDRVVVGSLGYGEVLFVGQTSFAPNLWVGVVLDEPNGKNNGSVQGKRYFECDDGYGVFIRPSQVRVLTAEEQIHDVDDDEEDIPPASAPISARTPAARSVVAGGAVSTRHPTTSSTSADATPSNRLSPRKSVAPSSTVRTGAARPSLGPATASTPAAVRRTSATSASSVSSTASRPTSSAAASRRIASPVKPLTSRTSPVKAGAPLATPSGRTSISSASARSAAASSNASRTASPITPAVAGRTLRPGLGATIASSRTPAASASASAARPLARTVASTGVKPQTPAAARAGLRPVASARPSMVASRTATSSPSVSAASRLNVARGGGVAPPSSSAPISRAGSALAVPARAGSSLAPSARLGARSAGTASAASSSGRVSASQRLLHDDDLEHEDQTLDEDSDPLNQETLLVEDYPADDLRPDDVDEDEDAAADVTISASPNQASRVSAQDASSLKSTRLLNKSTRDFMSLVDSSSSTNLRTSSEFGALNKEVEELRAKVRVLEKKRDDDRARIAELEKLKEAAELSIASAPKLNAKVQDLQAELKDQKKLEKDWALQRDDFERQISRLNDELESLTLDREMAEEKAESAILEAEEQRLALENANSKIAALQKEMTPRRLPPTRGDDGEALSDAEEDAVDDGPAYALIQRENDQLRRVLKDLRDRSNEIESDQRRKIVELEKENAELIELNSTNDSLLPELENAESMIEDLKMQLDDALGAQDLVEQLTERNLQLSDVVTKLRDEIEEMETIAEINNELEEQHTINEKELREEVDFCETRIRDLQIHIESLENNAADYQNTFSQFRELVSNLQSELEIAKAEQAELGGDGANRKDLADQAMLNLNLKLQSSALKSQAKTIDLELGKLQASQATSHLEMVRCYLPSGYFEADADGVNCLLFFRRMAVKSDLIKSIVETNHDIQESLSGVVPETLVGICQMRHSIAHFSALSRQIAAVLQLAPPEVFLKGGRMYRENMAIERKIDSFIEALRREELKEPECGAEFGRFVKQFEDFSLVLGGDENDSDLGAKEVGSANLIDHDLDTLIAALGYAKQQLAQLYSDDDIEWDMGNKSIEDDVFDPLQELINRIRATKVPTRKVLRRLLSLTENDEAVQMEAIIHLPPLGRLTSQLVTFAITLSKSISSYVAEVRSTKMAFSISKVIDFVMEATQEGLGSGDVSLWSGPLSSTSHLAQTIQTVLGAIVEQQNVIKISGVGPWISRSAEIKLQATQNPELERQVSKLSSEVRDLLRQVKARDQAIQESAIKIERLSKQLEKSKLQLEQDSLIRNSLVESQKQVKTYQEANDALQSELETLQRLNDQLLKQGPGGPATAAAAGDGSTVDGKTVVTAGSAVSQAGANAIDNSDMTPNLSSYTSLETTYLVNQLEALKGALRHLRDENAVLKANDLMLRIKTLPPIRRRNPTPIPTSNSLDDPSSDPLASKDLDSGGGDGGDESDTKRMGIPVTKTKTKPAPAGKVGEGSVQSQAKNLYLDALTSLALAKVVDLTPVSTTRKTKSTQDSANTSAEEDGTISRNVDVKGEEKKVRMGRPWVPYHKRPSVQFEVQQLKQARLMEKLRSMQQKVLLLSNASTSAPPRAAIDVPRTGGIKV